MSTNDLTDLLRKWPLEPGQINARLITAADESEKLQVRIDLGVLQMELDDRPDGRPPPDAPTLLESMLRKMEQYERQAATSVGFVLSSDECRALRQEAVHFYHRYVALFTLGDFKRVVRDTNHNMKILDLCSAFGETEADRRLLEQFRPQIIMMRSRAEAELAVQSSQPKQALEALDGAIEELRAIFAEHGGDDAFERSNEVQLLRGMRDALVPKLPASQRVELEERLRAAIDAENYELAAILRDELRMMQ